jgi:NAD+ kinase
MQVLINGSTRSRRILNEALFCHASPAATSRYVIHLGRAREEQRSSGFWIGPAAGSTAAQRSAGGEVLSLESAKLQLVVREPYTPRGQHYRLRRAVVAPPQQVTVRSMIQHAVLFLDGPYRRLRVRLGDTITFRASDEPLRLLGLSSRKTRR